MKIGITIKLGKGISFQSNGMLQNLYFLANSFNSVSGLDCYFLYLSSNKLDLPLDQEKFIQLNDYIESPPFKFDLIILGGFSSAIFDHGVFFNTKIIVFHCGATMIDDIRKCFDQSDQLKDNLNAPIPKVDEIWTLPQHANNLGYLSALYNNRNSKVMPYIWDSTFVDLQLHQNDYSGLEHFKKELLSQPLNSIHIYEPNNTFCKTCLIPLVTVVEHKRYGAQPLDCCRTFCAENIVKSQHFNEKCRVLGITSDKEYYEFHRRIPFIYSLKTLGPNSIILSHQMNCDLNYLYFDALYLGLPLLHNSSSLSEYGYYYRNSDIEGAIKKIDHILKNHQLRFEEYIESTKKLFHEYNPKNPHNLKPYEAAMYELVSIK